MEEKKKQFPTQETPKTIKKYSEMTPEEKEALGKRFQERLRKYYANRPSREAMKDLEKFDSTEILQHLQEMKKRKHQNPSKNEH